MFLFLRFLAKETQAIFQRVFQSLGEGKAITHLSDFTMFCLKVYHASIV